MEAVYIDSMGTDLSVVNAARVSFSKTSDWEYGECLAWGASECIDFEKKLKKGDERLINFLARGKTSKDWDALVDEAWHSQSPDELEQYLEDVRRIPQHFTPFTHTAITIRERVPIFVARQRFKHTVGFTYNEVSRRYVDDAPTFYIPDAWRGRSADKKQGSSDEIVNFLFPGEKLLNIPPVDDDGSISVTQAYEEFLNHAEELYNLMLEGGVAPEQARMILPQSMYTEYFVTGNLSSWARLYNQRMGKDAQSEITDLAKLIGPIIERLFPVSWKALTT